MRLTREKKEIVIGTDQNIDLLKNLTSASTIDLLNKIIEYNLFPCITGPTRVTNASATLIDNVYISAGLSKNYDSKILIEDISDHLPCLVSCSKHGKKYREPLKFSCRNFKDQDYGMIIDEMNKIDWTELHNKMPMMPWNSLVIKLLRA